MSFAVSSEQPNQLEQAAIYIKVSELVAPNSVIMTGDPPGFYYHTRIPSVITPNEPPEMLPVVAAQFGVDYLLFDPDRPPPLAELYEEKVSLPELEKVHDFGGGYVLYKFVHVEDEGN